METSKVVELKDFAPYTLPANRSNATLGVLLKIVAVLTVALAIYIGFAVKPIRVNYRIVLALVSLASITVVFLFTTGKRLQLDTRKKLADPRAPILYLRPFCHEHFVNAPIIYFDNEWRPVKATISRWKKIILFPTFSTMSTQVLREILRPVLRKRGMRLSVWRTVVYELVSKSVYGIIFFGALYLFFRFDGK